MSSVHAQVTVLAINAKTFGEIVRGVVGNRRRVYLITDSPCLQQLLNSCELRDRERALQRIVAARIEKHDNRGMSSEEFLERDRGAVVIFEDGFLNGFRAAAGNARP